MLRTICQSASCAVLALTLSGCGGDTVPGPLIDIEIARPGGASAMEGIESIRVWVQQGGAAAVEAEGEVSDSGFEVRVPLTDELGLTTLAVELLGPSRRLLGVAPAFVPRESGGLVRVPVGAPSSCERLVGMELGAGLIEPGLSRHATFALVIGGDTAEGPSADAGFLDLLQLTSGDFEDLESPIGPSRSVAFSRNLAVVLPSVGAPFVYDISSSEAPVLAAPLHAGAGYESATLELDGPTGAASAVVVGGGAEEAVVGVTWVHPDGTLRSGELVSPRRDPALSSVADGVLVVGGGEAGAARAEIISETGSSRIVDDTNIPDLRGGTLFVSEDGSSALLIAAHDPDGRPVAETVLFEGCPACTARAGPRWETVRVGASVARFENGGGLLVGGQGPSDGLDRVSFDGEVRIEQLPGLDAARARSATVVIDGGVVLVAGGLGDVGPRADVEVCFPDHIDWVPYGG